MNGCEHQPRLLHSSHKTFRDKNLSARVAFLSLLEIKPHGDKDTSTKPPLHFHPHKSSSIPSTNRFARASTLCRFILCCVSQLVIVDLRENILKSIHPSASISILSILVKYQHPWETLEATLPAPPHFTPCETIIISPQPFFLSFPPSLCKDLVNNLFCFVMSSKTLALCSSCEQPIIVLLPFSYIFTLLIQDQDRDPQTFATCLISWPQTKPRPLEPGGGGRIPHIPPTTHKPPSQPATNGSCLQRLT